jgi:hypothetical protein
MHSRQIITQPTQESPHTWIKIFEVQYEVQHLSWAVSTIRLKIEWVGLWSVTQPYPLMLNSTKKKRGKKTLQVLNNVQMQTGNIHCTAVALRRRIYRIDEFWWWELEQSHCDLSILVSLFHLIGRCHRLTGHQSKKVLTLTIEVTNPRLITNWTGRFLRIETRNILTVEDMS